MWYRLLSFYGVGSNVYGYTAISQSEAVSTDLVTPDIWANLGTIET